MIAAFTCPECGLEVELASSSAGRRLRCGECGTLIEVPFLRRVSSRRKGRGRSPALMIAGGGLIAAVVMIGVALFVAAARGRAHREAQVADAIQRSEKAEAVGHFSRALVECEAAIKIARTLDVPARKPLKERRDRLALRETESQLADAATQSDPVETYRAVLSRLEHDPAREPARGQVFEALSSAIMTRTELDLIEAQAAGLSGHAEVAMGLCERIARASDELGRERGGRFKVSAARIARSVLGRCGVVFAPVTGEFLQGPSTARLHALTLNPAVAVALRKKGYLPRPEVSAFLREWDDVSPYRFSIEIVERQQGAFFQTPLHTARLSSHLALSKNGIYVWQARPQGATRVPPPDMNTFEMSNISLAKTRDPALEKRLYNDARTVLAENVAVSLRALPGL